ncbi:DUF7322 domain-containing protein [Haloferacaceae archaeon DSL9]
MADDRPREDDDFVERWANPEDRWDDPESRWGNPERDLVDIPEAPTVQSFEAESRSDDELAANLETVDSDLLNTFVVAVVLTNLGVFAVSLGAMLWYFRGNVQLGVGLILVGTFSLLRVAQKYRAFRRQRDAADGDGESDADRSGDFGSDGTERADNAADETAETDVDAAPSDADGSDATRNP